MQHSGHVPTYDDAAVGKFLTKWQLSAEPVRLQFVEFGYEAAWCHVSAKHKALVDGGRRVHGWALWKFGLDVVADHHSVWENESGELVDVTPPSNGGTEILFVRDDDARIELSGDTIQLFTQRTSDAQVHWLWQGEPSEYSNWPCPVNKEDLVKYSAKLGIPVAAIVTDNHQG